MTFQNGNQKPKIGNEKSKIGNENQKLEMEFKNQILEMRIQNMGSARERSPRAENSIIPHIATFVKQKSYKKAKNIFHETIAISFQMCYNKDTNEGGMSNVPQVGRMVPDGCP